jgi:hypothetical protein
VFGLRDRPDRPAVRQGSNPSRWAVLRLGGIDELPASAMLEVTDQVRQALTRLGISDVRVEVVGDDEAPAGPPSAT